MNMPRAAVVVALALALAATGFTDVRAGEQESTGAPTLGLRPEPVLQVQIAPRLLGVTFDRDDFWLSQQGDGGSNPPMVHRVSQQGVIQESHEQVDAWVNGLYDVQYQSGYLWGSECWYLRGFGLNGTWPGSPYFMGSAVFTQEEPIRAVCHEPGSDRWFIGGHGQNVYSGTWNGVDGATPTWTPITSGPLPGPNGIAYDPDRGCLWLTDGISGTLHKLSPDGGPSLGQIPLLGSSLGKLRGCCLAEVQTPETMIVLGAILADDDERADDWLVLWDVEDIDDEATPVESTSWGSIKALYR
jgi:hypothetical protein